MAADSPLDVVLKGKLPLSLELPSSKVLDILTDFVSPHDGETSQNFRKRLSAGLWRRAKPGFYHELDKHLHIAYGHQKNGHGTEHYWYVFYDDSVKDYVNSAVKSSALVPNNASNGAENAKFEWGGLYLRSPAEVAIAKELEYRGLLFFANVRGRVSLLNTPLSEQYSNGRVELDFLVFENGKCVILEIDGSQHNSSDSRLRDYSRDRLMLKEGIPTARFTAQECLDATHDVINEFLSLF